MSSGNDPTIQSEPGRNTTDGDEAFCSACNQSFPMETERCPHDGAKLTKLVARPDTLLGRVFEGRYEIRTALGAGGMGTVYRGWQISVDREVAIKVIHAKLATDRTVVKRFLREARLSSRMSQPGIVNVYDFGQTDDGILYLVMELIRGRTLSMDLEAQRPLPLKRVIAIGSHLCDALEAAHGQGIVHRDLKPGNIMILDEPPGRDLLKVLDFGLSKSLITDTSSLVTHSSSLLGTPLYMSPEQIEGKASDQRGDLYSLGCILYQLASGRPPFVGSNINLVLAAHLSDAPAPLPASVPAGLTELVARLMEKSPERRTATAALARDALQRLVDAPPELSDTTPDISIERRTTPVPALGLAMTLPAGAAPARRPRWHWLAGGFSLASVAVIAMVALGNTGGSKSDSQSKASFRGKAGSGSSPNIDGLSRPPMLDAMSIDAAFDAAADASPDAALASRPHGDPSSHVVTVKRQSDAGVIAPVAIAATPCSASCVETF